MQRASLTDSQISVSTSLSRLTAPMMLGVSSTIVVQTLEMGFLGQLGHSSIAAITFTFPLTMILTSIALGISIGTSSVIARSVGGGDIAENRRLATHSLMVTALLMSSLSFVGWLVIDPAFRLLGANDSLLELIHDYLDIYYPGVVLFTLTMIASSIMRANGRAGVPGLVMTLGAVLNLAIDPILIFGWFGMPRMELAGAAAAMTVSRVVTSGILLYYVMHENLVVLQSVWDGITNSLRRILHIGLPAMATQMIGPITAALITRLLASHGDIVVAAYGVATRIEGIAVMLFFALSGSIGPFVGQNSGAGKHDRVREGLRVTYQFCIGWGLFMAVVLFFFGPTFAGWIEGSKTVIDTAGWYLAVVPWGYGMWGVLMMASASFNALGKPLPSTIMSFTRMFFLFLPLAWTLNYFFGYHGIFIATLASNLIMGAVGYFWLRTRIPSLAAA
jgi:putative MATE family efflux protein